MTQMITDSLLPLIELQGDIRVYLLGKGLSKECSREAACDITDIIAHSKVVRLDVRAAYAALEVMDAPDPDEIKPGDWLAVVDDSDCTVKLGGPGALWKCKRQSFHHPDCWELERAVSPYSKRIFRKATETEVKDGVARGLAA